MVRTALALPQGRAGDQFGFSQLLDRLQSRPVELAGDEKPLGAILDDELDRGVEFGRIEFFDGFHRVSSRRFPPRLTTPAFQQ